MLAKDCPCPECQKYAPNYPYFIRPVPKNNGFSSPRLVMQFHASDEEAMKAVEKWAPVYEWRMMSHEQVQRMYSGHTFTV